MISFSRPFYYWYPSPFPGHFYLRRFHVVAPYWTDHDIRRTGSICYETFERGRSQNDDSELNRVNTFLQMNQKSNFSGTFMIVAEWLGVHPYPHGSSNLNFFESNYPSRADFINQVLYICSFVRICTHTNTHTCAPTPACTPARAHTHVHIIMQVTNHDLISCYTM